MIIAVSYIGTDYVPGEILPDDLPEAFIQRLLKTGAVKESAPDPVSVAAKAEAAQEEIPAPEADEGVEEIEEEAAYEEPEEIEEEAAYEEPEAPEVDVTEALVTEPAPKTKSTKKGAKGK